MDKTIVIDVGNQVGSANYAYRSRVNASPQEETQFYSIIRTFASFIPQPFTELDYTSHEDEFQYEFVVDTKGVITRVAIGWAHDYDSNAKPKFAINSKIYTDFIEATQAVTKLFVDSIDEKEKVS